MTTDPLFLKENGQYYFYQNDHLGTPQKLTAVNGAAVWSVKYKAFGEAEIDASTKVINNLRFAGQYFDQENELHYNYFRYYDPVNGRYLKKDPLGLEGGINLFVYAANNTNNYYDPLGLLTPPRGTIPGCEDCNVEYKQLFRPTGKAWMKLDRKVAENIGISFIWSVDQTARIMLNFIPGRAGSIIGNIQLSEYTYTHTVGIRTFIVEYAMYECWIETCNSFPEYREHCFSKIGGTEQEVIVKESEILFDITF
jgi:RHS repeat-associated protein